ncbi:MAG: FAD/NAD(P)-binding protein [Gemmataceae bacterium]
MTSSPWNVRFAAVTGVKPETPGVLTYDLSPDSLPGYSFRPGQFNMLYLPGIGEAAISMSSDSGDPAVLRHTVRAVGNVTRAMAKLRIGDSIGVRGPFGVGWPVDELRGRDVVIVAGGVGLAPLRPMVYHLLRRRDQHGRVTILFGARTPADLLFADEHERWRGAGIDMQCTVNFGSPDWRGSVGTVMPLFANLKLDPGRTSVLTCGPEVMMRFVAAAAMERGLPEDRVHVSLERNMNCAVGLCGHCQFGPEFICKDGPVFPFGRVRRLLFVENL